MFDDAVACLRAVHSELQATQAAVGAAAQAAADGAAQPASALAAVAEALRPGGREPPQAAVPDGAGAAGRDPAPDGSSSGGDPAAGAGIAADGIGNTASGPGGAQGGGWGGLEHGRSFAEAVRMQLEHWEAAASRRESASRVLRWTVNAATVS